MIYEPDEACQSVMRKVFVIREDKQKSGIHAHIHVDLKTTFKIGKPCEIIVMVNKEQIWRSCWLAAVVKGLDTA